MQRFEKLVRRVVVEAAQQIVRQGLARKYGSVHLAVAIRLGHRQVGVGDANERSGGVGAN